MEPLLFTNKALTNPQDKILNAALMLYTEKGFRETTVLDIVECARVSKTTFYNFFKSKEELLAHLFQSLLDEVLIKVKLATQQEERMSNKAFVGIKRYLEICMHHRPVAQLLLVSSVGVSPAVEEVRYRAHVRFAEFIYGTVKTDAASDERIRIFAQAMVGAINEVVVQKVIRSDMQTDIEELARLLSRIVQGSYKHLINHKGML
ncbi:TetR/AcrR family transcriptional regulator [Parageobacillus thermoglucosidasius]|uniref:TetR/AcrR family transcriptional regulator n=1 Tax=Parageobacillus thermoglucosidasius TaxID=1426 RepID=A0AB38QYP1_PARTM|nr:TetR/AcrR family transcriptional regulator [Parageobacillus thermoglucosidasius]UOE75803.1 TetR/AcrR family transcriptional regulator [Parageobacillus thermoglucosidasius]